MFDRRTSRPYVLCRRCGARLAREMLEVGLCWNCCSAEETYASLLDLAGFGPMLRRRDPTGAATLRHELAEIVLDVPEAIALAVLESFDFGAPRETSTFTAADHDARIEAWWLCCDGAKVRDRDQAERLRRGVVDRLDGASRDVVRWFVAQLDVYVAQRLGPEPRVQLELFEPRDRG